jgi:hypothetical protein
MTNQRLYGRLAEFPLETAGGSYTFLQRLRRENGWTESAARRAVREYKRFLYLAGISPEPVTPPAVVDQVWHLHLVYTRSYWEELCGGVLGRALHHGPSAGGAEEREKFGQWYERTRALYLAEFGEAPPPEIWPSRLNAGGRYRWTDLGRYWLIRKPAFGSVLPGVAPVVMAGLGVIPLVAMVAGLLLFVFLRILTCPGTRGRRDGSGSDVFVADSDGGGDCGHGDSGGDCGGGDSGCGGGCGGGE